MLAANEAGITLRNSDNTKTNAAILMPFFTETPP
jgi:hypothetical protein